MNIRPEQKKTSVIEEALILKDEGKRLSSIVGKFPDYESEIREIFGTVVFIKENSAKISVSKNILKTLLSKIPAIPSPQQEARFRKEIEQKNNIYPSNIENKEYKKEEEEEEEVYRDLLTESQDNKILSRWKIILPVIVLSIVTGVILLKSDSGKKIELINVNSENSANLSGLNSVSSANDTATSTEEKSE